MIHLYGSGSPNVHKVAIMLEETGEPYTAHYVDVLHGANFEPEFQALNPIGKVPVIVDDGPLAQGQPIFESGAILMYLAETYRPALLPLFGPARWEVLKWLTAQVAYVGPMLGQVNHFQALPSEANSYGLRRFRDQAARIYRLLDDRLSAVPWLAGKEYSIADIATYPWVGYQRRHGFNPAEYPALLAWRKRLDERPEVIRGVRALAKLLAENPSSSEPSTPEQSDRLFGRTEPGPQSDRDAYIALGPTTTAKA